MKYPTHLLRILKLLVFLLLTPLTALARAIPGEPMQSATQASATLYDFIRKKARAGLARNGGGDAEAVSRAIYAESRRAGFDPVLIAALIEQESGFGVRKRGTHGEIGLMQIKPSTARWIAGRAGVAYAGPQTLYSPASNIRIGIAYLSFVRDRFASKGSHFLAAYNMGPAQARRNLSAQRGPGPYAKHVMARYRRFHVEFGSAWLRPADTLATI